MLDLLLLKPYVSTTIILCIQACSYEWLAFRILRHIVNSDHWAVYMKVDEKQRSFRNDFFIHSITFLSWMLNINYEKEIHKIILLF